MSLLSKIINFAAPLPNIEEFNTYLFVGPHPDDIEIGAGATACKLASLHKKVVFLICTDGRFGESNTKLRNDELVQERKKEAILSASKLGVSDVRFLDYCDGNFYNISEMKIDVAKIIGDVQPDIIFAPDPDSISECHADHVNVGKICKELANFASNESIMGKLDSKFADVTALAFYMTAKTNKYVNTTGYLDKQIDAIFKSHLTQFPEGCSDEKSIGLYLKLRAYDFGLRSFCKTAEGFRVLGRTQMHCLPEAGL